MKGIVSVIVTAVDIASRSLRIIGICAACLICVYNAKVAYVNLVMYCGGMVYLIIP